VSASPRSEPTLHGSVRTTAFKGEGRHGPIIGLVEQATTRGIRNLAPGSSPVRKPTMPVIAIPRMLLSLLSLILLGAGLYLLWTWYQGYDITDRHGVLHHDREAWRLYAGLGLFAWSFLGRFVVLMFIPAGQDEPREERGEASVVMAPDGAALHVESFGEAGRPTLVLTHGWGLNSTAWWYAKHALAGRYRLITWDLPGLGRSKLAKDGKITIDRFAEALGAVVEWTGSDRVVLVGHSIGGMTTQTLWRACPQSVLDRVAGVVLVNTTPEDPLRTMWLSPVWRALRWPLIEPLSWLTIALSPLAWLSSWQSYLSGANQLAMRLTGFGRHATRGQVDFTARLACKGSPGVQAKGNLAMFRWKATDVLNSIEAPMLVLTGARDIVTLPGAGALIADVAPHARLVRIEGVGHMGFMERAAIYNEAIAAFVDEAFAGHRPGMAGR
jgi:pimeloyl-ACP methyl ester carboxylesterase